MTWKLEYNSELQIIDLVFSGNVSGSELQEATTKGISLSQEHGITEFLIDAAHMEQTGMVTDVYALPQQYVEEDLNRQSRIGFIVPIAHELQSIVRFYEDVCVNRGWHVQSFTNRRDAIGWLLKS